MGKKSLFAQDRFLDGGGMRKHREDNLHLWPQSGGGVGPSRTFSHQGISLFTSPVEDDKGVTVFLQVCRHSAAHNTQTDKTDFHWPLPASSATVSISVRSD